MQAACRKCTKACISLEGMFWVLPSYQWATTMLMALAAIERHAQGSKDHLSAKRRKATQTQTWNWNWLRKKLTTFCMFWVRFSKMLDLTLFPVINNSNNNNWQKGRAGWHLNWYYSHGIMVKRTGQSIHPHIKQEFFPLPEELKSQILLYLLGPKCNSFDKLSIQNVGWILLSCFSLTVRRLRGQCKPKNRDMDYQELKQGGAGLHRNTQVHLHV